MVSGICAAIIACMIIYNTFKLLLLIVAAGTVFIAFCFSFGCFIVRTPNRTSNIPITCPKTKKKNVYFPFFFMLLLVNVLGSCLVALPFSIFFALFWCRFADLIRGFYSYFASCKRTPDFGQQNFCDRLHSEISYWCWCCCFVNAHADLLNGREKKEGNVFNDRVCRRWVRRHCFPILVCIFFLLLLLPSVVGDKQNDVEKSKFLCENVEVSREPRLEWTLIDGHIPLKRYSTTLQQWYFIWLPICLAV